MGPRQFAVAASPQRIASDPDSFFDELASNTGDREVDVARRLVDWMSEVGLTPTYNRGKQVVSCIPTLICNSLYFYPVSIRSSGKIYLQVQDLRSRTVFKEEPERLALLELVNQIPGVNIEREKITGRPGIDLSLLEDEDALARLKAALLWMFDRIRAS